MHLEQVVVSFGTEECSQPTYEPSKEGKLTTKAVKWTLVILPDWVFKVALLIEGFFFA